MSPSIHPIAVIMEANVQNIALLCRKLPSVKKRSNVLGWRITTGEEYERGA
jgi:hypothetical protein